jgi:hypothetical protein
MAYRNYRKSDNSPRPLIVKFDGKCRCCGAIIRKGEMATYYPDKRAIAHIGGLEGTSGTCTANIRERMEAGYADVDRAYEDQCADICGR